MGGLFREPSNVPRGMEEPEGEYSGALDLLLNLNPAVSIGQWLAQPQTWRDNATGYRYQLYNDNTVAERVAESEAYDRANDDIFRITGRRLRNPVTDEFADPLGQGSLAEVFGGDANERTLGWHRQVAELAVADPRVQYLSRETMLSRADAIRRSARRAYHEYLGDGPIADQVLRGLMVAPGLLAGGIASGAPEQLAQFGAAGAGRFGGVAMGPVEELLARAGAGASANILAQAAIEPAIVEDARRMGEEHTAGMVALDFLLAGVLGGALEAAPALGRTRPPLREMATLPPATRDVTPLDASGAGETVREAYAGRAESLAVGAVQRDLATARDLAGTDAFPVEAMADQVIAADRYVRGEADAPITSEAIRVADQGAVEAAARQADEAPPPPVGTREAVTIGGVTRPRTFERFAPDALGFDPATFQYKRSAGAQGSTGRLDGVEVWDGQSAGKIVVYEAADGRLYVADGHQRVALAQALSAQGDDIALDGYRYREADGWTAREVRNIAAQKNLRETVGDPLDAAMLMRDAPDLIDSSIPQRGGDFRTARALARLSDDAFAAVRSGAIDPKIGAVIGDVAAARPELHGALVDLFTRSPPANARDAAFIAREALQATVVRVEAAQLSMFGDSLLISGMQERATILRHAGEMLREDKRVFAVAERHAGDLEAAGNILASEENARRRDLAAALLREFDTLATRPGPVADALREIAARAAENKTSAKVAAREFVDAVSRLMEERGLLGLYVDPPLRAPPPAKIELPDFEAEARSAKLRAAHDRDTEALTQTMAEIALERSLRGEVGEVIPADAIGSQIEADMARIEDAAAALGLEPDFSEVQVAAAIFARADNDLADEARLRLAPERDATAESEAKPATFAEALEQDAETEAPWRPDEFDDAEKLQVAISAATLPELEAVARELGAAGEARTRAEYAALLQEPSGFFARAPTFYSALLPRSFLELRAQTDADAQLWADANVWRSTTADGTIRLRFRSRETLGQFDTEIALTPSDKGGLYVEMTWRGRSERKTLRANSQSVGRAMAVFLRTVTALRAYVSSERPEAIVFGGQTEAHRRFYLSLVRALPIEGYEVRRQVLRTVQEVYGQQSETRLEFLRLLRDDVATTRALAQGHTVDQTLGTTRLVLELTPEEVVRHANEQAVAAPRDGGPRNDDARGDRGGDGDDGMDGDAAAGAASSRRSSRRRSAETGRLILDAAEQLKAENAGDLPARWSSAVAAQLNLSTGTVRQYTQRIKTGAFGEDQSLRLARLERPGAWDRRAVEGTWRAAAILASEGESNAAIAATLGGNASASSVGGLVNGARRRVRAEAQSRPLADIAEDLGIDVEVAEWLMTGRRSTGPEGEVKRVVRELSLKRQPDGTYLRPQQIAERMQRMGYFADLDVAEATERVLNRRALMRAEGIELPRFVKEYQQLTPQAQAARDEAIFLRNTEILGDKQFRGNRIRTIAQEFSVSEGTVTRAIDRHQARVAGQFSRGDGAHAPAATVAQWQAAAREAFPRYGEKLMERARLNIVQTVDELPKSAFRGTTRADRGTWGYAEGGQAWIIAENAPIEEARGLILHEVGKHVGMPEMLGEAGHAQFLSEVERLYQQGDADIRAGHESAIAAGTPKKAVWEETIAYALQNANPDTMSTGLRGLIMRIANSVRAWLWRTFPGLRLADTLSFEDMRWLALGGLRHAARNDPRVIDASGRGWLARGRDPERRSEAFHDPRLGPQENKAVEMARNNYSNAEIADELDVTTGQVRVLLSTAAKKLGGPVWERGQVGRAGMDPQTGGRTASTAEMVALRERLIRSGVSPKRGHAGDAINRMIADRLSAKYGRTITANAVASRISKHQRALRTDAAEADRLEQIVRDLKDCQ